MVKNGNGFITTFWYLLLLTSPIQFTGTFTKIFLIFRFTLSLYPLACKSSSNKIVFPGNKSLIKENPSLLSSTSNFVFSCALCQIGIEYKSAISRGSCLTNVEIAKCALKDFRQIEGFDHIGRNLEVLKLKCDVFLWHFFWEKKLTSVP